MSQTALDKVSLAYSAGRVLVTVPNGLEVGDNAWLVGVSNTIYWVSTTGVNGPMIIEFSEDSGVNWSLVTNNIPNVAGTNQFVWLTPGQNIAAEKSQCRIRVRDANDNSIFDTSDSNFQLVYRYRLTRPNGGEKFYIGTTNAVTWSAPPSLGPNAWLYYNRNASTTDFVRINGDNANSGVGTTNVYNWSIPTTNNDLLSEHARMKISVQGAPLGYYDISDNEYVLAGIGFIAPDQSTAWKRGNTYAIQWISSGAGSNGVDIAFANDGVTWTNIALGVTNSVGTNSYNWLVTADQDYRPAGSQCEGDFLGLHDC